jgi:hypothetical protein
MVNKDLLRETLDAVIAADAVGDWNQQAWMYSRHRAPEGSCGTAGCFAGWRAILDGYTQASGVQGAAVDPINRTFVDVMTHATKRLGLNGFQADVLFAGTNTLKDLKRIVDELCEQES